MTIITKGMGAVIKGALKKGAKKVAKRAKEDAPFAAALGAAFGGRQAYLKLRYGKTDLADFKEALEKRKKRKKDASLHKGEK